MLLMIFISDDLISPIRMFLRLPNWKLSVLQKALRILQKDCRAPAHTK